MSKQPAAEFLEMLGTAAKKAGPKFPSLTEQVKTLEHFLSEENNMPGKLKVGDYVVRTQSGQVRYKFPEDGQICRVITIFDKLILDEDGQIVNGEIAMACIKDDVPCVVTYTVDLRYYRKANDIEPAI